VQVLNIICLFTKIIGCVCITNSQQMNGKSYSSILILTTQ